MTYTIEVKNQQPTAAAKVTLTDPRPPFETVVAVHPSQGFCTGVGSTVVTCSLGTLTPGASAQILVTSNIAANAVTPSIARNAPRAGWLAIVLPADAANASAARGANASAAHGTDGTAANAANAATSGTDVIVDTATTACPTCGPPASASAVISVIAGFPPQATADVQIVKTVNHATAIVGQTLTYRLAVKNNGPDVATGVALTDTTSLLMHVLSVATSQGTCVPSPPYPFACQLGTIAPGATVTVTARASIEALGTEVNTGSVTTEALDPNLANNISSATTRIFGLLKLSKTAPPDVGAGEKVTFHLKVSNPTIVALTSVKVCDQLPLGLALAGSSPKARLSNGRFCWTIAKLHSHGSKRLTLTALALPGASGRLVNHATATAPSVRKPARARRTVTVIPASLPPSPVTG